MHCPIGMSGLNGSVFAPAWLVQQEADGTKANMTVHTKDIPFHFSYHPTFLSTKKGICSFKITYLKVHNDFMGQQLDLLVGPKFNFFESASSSSVAVVAAGPDSPTGDGDAASAAASAARARAMVTWKKACKHLFT